MKSAQKKSAIKTIDADRKLNKESNKNIKVYIVLSCVMEKTIMLTGDTVEEIAHFSTESERVLESTDLDFMKDQRKIFWNIYHHFSS